jgi:hypothetical protein
MKPMIDSNQLATLAAIVQASATQVAIDKINVSTNATAATVSAASASTSAAATIIAAATINTYVIGAATDVPKGAVAISSTAGSGGTNSVNNLATYTGGTLTYNPVIYYDVVGNAVTNVRMTFPGLYIGSSTPTMPTVVLANGGTGTITLTQGKLYAVGQSYWVVSAGNTQLLHYTNVSGSPSLDYAGPYLQAGSDAAIVAALVQPTAPLIGLSANLETVGSPPSTTGTGPFDVFYVLGTPCVNNGVLKGIVVKVISVAGGTARVKLLLPTFAASTYQSIGNFAITGITTTGVQTLVAGVHFPAGIRVIAGTKFALGAATGGASFDISVDIGNGRTVVYNTTAGYAITETAYNYKANFQVIIDPTTTVSSAIAILPVPAVREITNKEGPAVRTVLAGGDQGQNWVASNGIPFEKDCVLDGVEYSSIVGGDVLWQIWRPQTNGTYLYITGWKATIGTGAKLYSANPSPFWCKAGDYLFYVPITGRIGSQNWSRQPGLHFPADGTLSGATPVTVQVLPAFRAWTSRPLLATEIAMRAGRGRTAIINERFTSLPTGAGATQWTANNNGWALNSGGGLKVSTGYTGGSAWDRWYRYNSGTAANRRTFSCEIYMGKADNVGGLCSFTYNAGTGNQGSIIHIDGPAALLRMYLWTGSGAPADAGLSVALPWTPADDDVLRLTGVIVRGTMVVTLTKVNSYPYKSVTLDNALSSAIWGGLMNGNIGAHFRTGTGGMVWRFIKNETHWKKGHGAKIVFGDSTYHGAPVGTTATGWDNVDSFWMQRVEDARGRPDFINCAKSSADSSTSLAQLTNDFTALVGSGSTDGVGVEVLWGIGVNPNNTGGTTDAIRYANYKADTLAAAAIVEATGAKFTIITPTPANYISSYVQLLVSNLLAGDLGNREIIDVNAAVAASLSNRGTWADAGMTPDDLHPDWYSPNGAKYIANAFQAIRPDMLPGN